MKRAALVVGLSIILARSPARGDVIVLRGGGQVRGKVIPDPTAAAAEKRVLVVLLRGKTPLSLREDQIREVRPEPGPLDEYAARRGKLAPAAAAEHELGLWCADHELPDLAELHFEAALKRDPNFAPALAGLGRAEAPAIDAPRGDDAEPREESESASWLRRVKIIARGLVSESADRRREADDQLMSLEDPAAVGPLVKVMAGEEPALRILLSRALGEIPGPAASRALVDLFLREPDDSVRAAILEPLRRRPGDLVAARLTRALKSPDVRIINRAARGLGELEVFAAVPRLLDVLVTTEERMVLVPSGGPAYGPPGPPIAFNGSAAAYMTGPIVGPGVVAYGATVVPNTFALDPFNGGAPLTFGDGVGPRFVGADKGPQPAIMTFASRNVEVLGALNRLTGNDFGYDVDAWRVWVTRSFNPRPRPARMAPQP